MERKHTLKEGQRIRLKGDGQDSYYDLAQAGSEGWVRGLGFDQVDFPMIFVEWDKDHWAYNGEEDQITFEDHFEVVAEANMEPEDQDEPNIVEWIAAQAGTTEEELRKAYAEAHDPTPELKPKASSVEDEYDAELGDGVDDALQAEAFIILTVNAEPTPDGRVALVPKVYQASHTPTSLLIAQTFMSKAAVTAHEKVTDLLIEVTSNNKPTREG